MNRFSFAVLACTLAAASTTVVAAPAADKPVRGGTLTFAAHLSEPSTFDCHAVASAGPIWRLAPHYSTLLQIDPDRYPQVKGDLAKSWTVSRDGLTYEFKLHTNVKFHDGTALTSKDVLTSLERMRNPPQGLVSMHAKYFVDVKAIEAPDAQTVVVRLARPNATMLQFLAMPFGCIYSADLLASDPTYPAKRVMGSGPFKFVRHVAGKEWEGERYGGYFKASQPYLDAFRILTVNPQTGLNAMLAGQVHYIMQGLTKADVMRVKEAQGDRVNVVGGGQPTPLQLWFVMNTQRAPFNDVRVRQAFQLALDHNAGARAMQGFSAVNRVGGMLRPGSVFARSETELAQLPGYGYDIAASRKKARSLLEAAGHPAPKVTVINAQIFSFLGVFVADQLRQIGVTVDHRVVPAPQLYARRSSGDFDLILDNPPEHLDDPTVQFAYFLPYKDNPANVSRSNDEKFVELYTAQARELDPKVRAVRVREMENYLFQQAYALPLFWQDWRRAISSDVGGLNKELPSNFLKIDLADIWLRSGGKSALN